jgi:hypothetical protein
VIVAASSDAKFTTAASEAAFGYSRDTDGDGLFDDDEYALYGTDPLHPDSLSEMADALAVAIDKLDLALFDAPNATTAAARRDSMATRTYHAADAVDRGRIRAAVALLEGILDQVDGVSPPPDWLLPSPQADALADQVLLMLMLADLE